MRDIKWWYGDQRNHFKTNEMIENDALFLQEGVSMHKYSKQSFSVCQIDGSIFNMFLGAVELNQGFSALHPHLCFHDLLFLPLHDVVAVSDGLQEASLQITELAEIIHVDEIDDFLLEDRFFRAHLAVPVIFDRVVCSSRQDLRNHRPLMAVSFYSQGQQPFFFIGPFILFHSVFQMVVPPFSALLSSPKLEVEGNSSPVFGSVFFNKGSEHVIFWLSPSTFGATFWFLLVGLPVIFGGMGGLVFDGGVLGVLCFEGSGVVVGAEMVGSVS